MSTGVRRLVPVETELFGGEGSSLHCSVKGEPVYRGVFAIRLFPVRHPAHYISLRYTDSDDKDREIGVIEDLAVFRHEYGLLFFDVQTQSGRHVMTMPWRGDRAEEYGENGRVLLDALDNRYIIPDLAQLPAADRQHFTSFIYW
ncbi:MAG: hypothetical protein O3A51_00250 [Verrucomicrobia bacterium]|nr:hypothetical protein [Verrucomicrobiota bacterium]